MDTARIAALLPPFLERSLSQSQLDQISIYIDLLLRWNARMNLTAIRNEQEIVTRHFGESLFLARHLFPHPPPPSGSKNDCHPALETDCYPERSRTIREANHSAESKDPYPPALPPAVPIAPLQAMDIGSGAGFPALPLKIWAPNLHLTLIESNHKKAAFLSEVARCLTLTNVNVMADRAEVLAPRLASQSDLVTLRAVERFETILPQAVTFLVPQGTLALLITKPQLELLKPMTDLNWRQEIKVPESKTRLLLIGSKQ
jgi:16S rRNA (guanine527-N7)-methyltransferase